jgi:hypothetical protein
MKNNAREVFDAHWTIEKGLIAQNVACAILGIGKSTMQYLRKTGRIKEIEIPGTKTVLLSKRDIDSLREYYDRQDEFRKIRKHYRPEELEKILEREKNSP